MVLNQNMKTDEELNNGELEGRNIPQLQHHVSVTPQGCINRSPTRLEIIFCCQLKWDTTCLNAAQRTWATGHVLLAQVTTQYHLEMFRLG